MLHILKSRERKMKIYIYSNDTGEQIDRIEGVDNNDCEDKAAEAKWDSNEYHYAYCDVVNSNAV